MSKINKLIIFTAVAVLVICCIIILAVNGNHSSNYDNPAESSAENTINEKNNKETAIDSNGNIKETDDIQQGNATFTIKSEDDSDVTVEIGIDEMTEFEEAQDTSTPGPKVTDQPKGKEQLNTDSQTDTKEQTDVTVKSGELKWEEFYALSPEEQDVYMQSFNDIEAFYEWMIEAQKQFSVEHPDIEIGPGGSIDLSKLS